MILRRTSVSVVPSSESDTNLSDQVITGWEVLLEGRDPHPGSLNIVGRGSTTLEASSMIGVVSRKLSFNINLDC